MNHVVSFSSGIDSVATVLKIMEENDCTKDHIDLYYIEIKNNKYKTFCEEYGFPLENFKINNIYRQTVSEIQVSGFRGEGVSQPLLWLSSVCMALNATIDYKIYFGYNKDDCVTNNGAIPYITSAFKHLYWIANPNNFSTPQLCFPLINMTKKEIVEYIKRREKELDTTLLEYSWTCETPQFFREYNKVGYKKCGTCVPCLAHAKLGILENHNIGVKNGD